MSQRIPLIILFGLALAGCGPRVNAAFGGAAIAGLALVVTLFLLNRITKGRNDSRTQLIRSVIIGLLLLTMIGMLVLIVVQSGIGRI